MAKISGKYFLGVKYEGDSKLQPFGLKVEKSGDNNEKFNLEALDSLTSRFSSKEELCNAIQNYFKGNKKIDDVGIYHTDKEMIIKDEMIINDPFIHQISNQFCMDKYYNGTHKQLNRDTKGMRRLYADLMNIVKNPEGLQRISDNWYLRKKAMHLYDKLLEYGSVYKDIQLKAYNDEFELKRLIADKTRLDKEIETELLTKYTIFRETYIAVFENKNRKMENEVEIQKKEENNIFIDSAERIEDSFLKEKYNDTDGDAEEIFMYFGESFCDELSDNDKKIVFENYDVFKERMKNEYPDLSNSR